ncbi:MAG: C25 family cysteine peptidase [Actinomycetota bacterium]|nr:C25 family cysteine peptidase [Actinomycetota bacterium]
MKYLRFALTLISTLMVICVFSAGCANQVEIYPKEQGKKIDLLIITHKEFFEDAQKLARFKTKNGIPAAVVTTSHIEKNFEGKDLPEKMRELVREYHRRKKIKYLLLLGDEKLVPVRYVYCPFEGVVPGREREREKARRGNPLEYERYYVPSDLYFANLSDNWDINRNGIYGEITGNLLEGGYSHDISVGRIPAKSARDLKPVIEKIMDYRKPGEERYLLIEALKDMGQILKGYDFSKRLRSIFQGWEGKILREGKITPSEVIREINSGNYSVVVGITHGFPFGLVVNSIKRLKSLQSRGISPQDEKNVLEACRDIRYSKWYEKELSEAVLDSEKVKNLRNKTPFFFLGFGCVISAFDYEPDYSITEALVMQEGGAISACGMSRDFFSFTRDDYKAALEKTGGLHFEIGEDVLENFINKKMTFGDALARAIDEYTVRNSSLMKNSDQRRVVLGMTLIGDPSI